MGSWCTKRFLRTAALLASDIDNERLTAARQASAMLRDAGLDWATVLQAGLKQMGVSDPEPTPPTASDPVRQARTKFDDLFQQVRAKAREVVQPSAEPNRSSFLGDVFKGVSSTLSSVTKAVNEARTPAKEISGTAIPAQVEGIPELIQEVRLTRPMLVFSLIWGNHRYGPMVAYDNLEQIHKAIQQGQSIVGMVAPETSALDFPRFQLALA